MWISTRHVVERKTQESKIVDSNPIVLFCCMKNSLLFFRKSIGKDQQIKQLQRKEDSIRV